jgi:ribosome-associated protein
MSPADPEARTVEIRDESIRLGQLLKLAALVDDGGEAKEVLARGLVEVNGEVETRRGRRIVPGDSVRIGDRTVAVVHVGIGGDGH